MLQTRYLLYAILQEELQEDGLGVKDIPLLRRLQETCQEISAWAISALTKEYPTGILCSMNKEIPTNGLYDHTGYWLRRLSNLIHQTFEHVLAEHDVTVAQWNVLVAIHHGDAITPFDLARFIDIDTGAVTRLVDRLVEKRLLKRLPDPTDRRSVRLQLTSKGYELVPKLVQIADENDKRFFGSLTSAEHQQLKELISMLLADHGISTSSSWRNQ